MITGLVGETQIAVPDAITHFTDVTSPRVENEAEPSTTIVQVGAVPLSLQDHRSVTIPTQSHDPRRKSRQFSPKVNPGSGPILPKGDLPQSGAATPITATAPSAPCSKFATFGSITEELAASSRTDLPDKIATKDPRLRRISTKSRENSEAVTAPNAASPRALTSAVNKSTPFKDQSKDTNAGSLDLTRDASNTRSISPSTPETPLGESGDVMKMPSALSDAVMQNPANESNDVTMTDVNKASSIVTSVAHDSLTMVQAPEGSPMSTNLLDSFTKLMTDFADQVSTTSILRYKKDIAKQKSSRCKYNDRRNRENFKDYPVTIEQGIQTRQLAEQELASVDQKLKEHVTAQNELARTMAGFLVSQIEQQKSAQDVHREKERMLQKSLDEVEALSTKLNSALAEARQAKLNSAQSVNVAFELFERATSACQDAQQGAQKAYAQVNEVTARVDDLYRKASEQRNGVSEDKAQISKVMSDVEHLNDDLKSLRKRTDDTKYDVKHLEDNMKSLRKSTADAEGLVTHLKNDMQNLRKSTADTEGHVTHLKVHMQTLRKRTADAEDEVKSLGSLKAPLSVLEEMRKDFNEDATQLKKIQKEVLQGLQSDITELRRSFQDLSEKSGSSVSQSELDTLRKSIAGLQIAIEKLNTGEYLEALEAYRKDVEADREELRELTNEVDELHTGQDQIRDTFTEHNGNLAKRVDKAEKEIHDISKEIKVNLEKTKEKAQAIAKQINGVSKKVEATITEASTQSTPPSAPPTPQMNQPSHLPGRGHSPVVDNGPLMVKLNKFDHDLMQLGAFINRQFPPSHHLPDVLESLKQGILNLDNRYNNLTTEPVIRAMVQQMQLMYPYASTAQKDIRDFRAAVSELEKLPPKIDFLLAQLDLHARNIANLDQKFGDQDKERLSSDDKQERLVAHLKEEHEKLKQHVEKQYKRMDRSFTAVKEESILSVAQVASKVDQLEKVADTWIVAKKAEQLLPVKDKVAAPKPVTPLKVNRPTAARASLRHPRPLSQTRASSPGEPDSEALLKQFDASTRSKRIATISIISDTDDSDGPLGLTQTNSVTAASPNRHAPETPEKRKRAHDTSSDLDVRQSTWEVPSSPSKRKVPRR